MKFSVIDKIRIIQKDILDFVVRRHPALGLEKRAEFFVNQFHDLLAPNSLILDIGGGWGFYAEPLERRGHALTVLDVVLPKMQKAPVVLYDGERMPFPDKSFDSSIIVTALHHIPDPIRILAEARRVTRDHVVVIEDLYHHRLGRCWTKWRDQLFNFEFFGHANQFRSENEWREVFKNLDFSILKHENVYTWLSGLRILNGIFILKV